MRMFLSLLVVYSVSLSADALLSTSVRGGLDIYDGSDTTIKKYPYIVRIYGDNYFWCAGTIINNNWVITSGICANTATAESDLKVVTGSSGKDGTQYSITERVFHPKFDSDNYNYNYALLKTSSTIEFSNKVKNVTLPSESPKTGTQVTIVGYGAQGADDDTYDQLRQGEMKWISSSNLLCKWRLLRFGFGISESNACASSNGGTTPCTGDIGDPLLVGDVLYGMVGYPSLNRYVCVSEADPSLVMDIFTAVDWIQEQTHSS